MTDSLLHIILLVVSGFCILVWCINKLWEAIVVGPDYIKTEGKIINIATSRTIKGNLTTIVKFTYTSDAGRTITSEINGSTYPSLYVEGELIPVAYNKENNEKYIVTSSKQKWFYIFSLIFSLFLFTFGIINLCAYYSK